MKEIDDAEQGGLRGLRAGRGIEIGLGGVVEAGTMGRRKGGLWERDGLAVLARGGALAGRLIGEAGVMDEYSSTIRRRELERIRK